MHTTTLTRICLASTLLVSCARYPKPQMEQVAGGDDATPVFVIDGAEAPRIITVERLPERGESIAGATTWHLLRRIDATVELPLRLTYGVTPEGYREMQPALPLVAGRYRLYAKLTHAGGELRFTATGSRPE